MAFSFGPSFLRIQYFIHFMGFFNYNLQAEKGQFHDFFAIFYLTLRHPYAILFSDYPTDSHSSRIQEG